MNLADQVIIAKDVKVFPLRGEWTEHEDQASVRGHITPNNAAKDGWQYRWRYDPHM